MSKRINDNLTDTVSHVGDPLRVIAKDGTPSVSFEYGDFCKKILEFSKQKVDACFLVPIRAYHSWTEIRSDEIFPLLEKWLDIFIRKENKCIYFWPYLVVADGYNRLCKLETDEEIDRVITRVAEKDAKACMNDVSKMDKLKYVESMYKSREAEEVWILKIYDLMLRRLYTREQLDFFVKKAIDYLRSCNIRISTPVFELVWEKDDYIIQTAAGIMLLIMRLRVGISPKQALEWYQHGNVAYFGYCDRKLEEYMQIIQKNPYLSYERFAMMKNLAEKNENKYAAKEVGDVYLLGTVLKDSYGTEISILPDAERASNYYRTCIMDQYVCAYCAALKTNTLIQERQYKEILKEALSQQDQQTIAFYAKVCLEESEKSTVQNKEKILEELRNIVELVCLLETTYWEKYVLKNEVLDSKIYLIYKENPQYRDEKLEKFLLELYGRNPLKLDDKELDEERMIAYEEAGKLGYFEADYRLGGLLQKTNPNKSQEYYARGMHKGCTWCMLEYAKMEKTLNRQNWLKKLMEISRRKIPEELKMQLAKEFSQCNCVLEELENKQIVWDCEDVMELYFQINQIENWLDGYTGTEGISKEERVKIQGELLKHKRRIWDYLTRND